MKPAKLFGRKSTGARQARDEGSKDMSYYDPISNPYSSRGSAGDGPYTLKDALLETCAIIAALFCIPLLLILMVARWFQPAGKRGKR